MNNNEVDNGELNENIEKKEENDENEKDYLDENKEEERSRYFPFDVITPEEVEKENKEAMKDHINYEKLVSEKLEEDDKEKNLDNDEEILDEEEEILDEEEEILDEEEIQDDEYNIHNNTNVYKMFGMYIYYFFDEIFNYSICGVKKIIKIILLEPYHYLSNIIDNNDNNLVIWLDKNILSNYVNNVNNSIKISGLLFVCIIIYIICLHICILTQSMYINKIMNDISEINNIIDEQEYMISNIVKVGFNYLVDNNCKFINE